MLALISSLTFYPKSATEAGYMLLTLRTGGRPTLVAISPTGEQHEYLLVRKTKGQHTYQAQLMLHLNKLRQQGWEVVQMQTTEAVLPNTQYPLLDTDTFTTLTFLLEKR